MTAEAAVLGLVSDAMKAAAGEIPDLADLLARVEEATERAEQHDPDDPTLLEACCPLA